MLLQSGIIGEALRCQDKKSYEIIFNKKHHDHMLCINCGKTIEFYSEEIERLQNEICKKYAFTPLEHKLGIKGYCKECYKKIKSNQK